MEYTVYTYDMHVKRHVTDERIKLGSHVKILHRDSSSELLTEVQTAFYLERGGFIFDNRRYTWGELGASVSNGVFTEDFAYKATGANGETIELDEINRKIMLFIAALAVNTIRF